MGEIGYRKKNKPTSNEDSKRLSDFQQIVGSLLGRMNFAKGLGKQYGGKRDIYEALGYPKDHEITFGEYYGKYERNTIAAAVIDRPVDTTWYGNIRVRDEDGKESKLVEEWKSLEKRLHIKRVMQRLDKLTGIGEFGVLFLGLDDAKKEQDFQRPVSRQGNRKLMYIKPFGQGNVMIDEWETNAANPRYGLPKVYKIEVGSPDKNNHKTHSVKVHYERIIHVVDGTLVSECYGKPRLKAILNRIYDLEKLLGGDAEMFWRGARPGYAGNIGDEYDMPPEEQDELEKQLDEYENELRRFIIGSGVDLKSLEQQIADPLYHFDIQVQAISAEKKIPKRILIGSERGELASNQDVSQWLSTIQSRRQEFAEPVMLRPFIDFCMKHGILSQVENYVIEWDDLFAPSEREKAEIGKLRAQALKTWSTAPTGPAAMPTEQMYKWIMGLSDDAIEDIKQTADNEIIEEEEDMVGIDDGSEDGSEEGTEEDRQRQQNGGNREQGNE